MKRYLMITLYFTFSMTVWAQSHNHATKEHDHKLATHMDEVLKINDELFNALLGTDQKIVEMSSKSLSGVLAKSTYPELSKLSTLLKNFKASNTKAKNIEVYSDFMPSFIEVFKKNNINTNYEIYYCPMVKKYWIQNSKKMPKVQNVFAQDMLECGEKKA
ncbi:MAG: hypothetical protein ACOYL6_16260 [Bacteriovoracaceae bacterium]